MLLGKVNSCRNFFLYLSSHGSFDYSSPYFPLEVLLVKIQALVMFTEFLAQISSIRNYLHLSVPYWACKLFDLCDLGLS